MANLLVGIFSLIRLQLSTTQQRTVRKLYVYILPTKESSKEQAFHSMSTSQRSGILRVVSEPNFSVNCLLVGAL